MRRVLVANRGEIALRAIRACRQLGHESLAVFSSADANSPHRWAADHAICIGPPPATASYLNAAALLETAIATKCDAIYPGYGFLAENAGFARACADAQLTFIGPSPQAIALMGSKTAAREAAIAAGVGAKVALIERHLMGGDCLNVGCVPSKAMIRASRQRPASA